MKDSIIYDFIIIGSGFGGSVAAMRLTEKGYNVLVLEKGKRFSCTDLPKSDWDLRKYLWSSIFGWKGILQLRFFKKMFILSGSGVGGGSLVYANALMEPAESVYREKGWLSQHHWQSVLAPHFETARKILGSTPYTDFHEEDLALKRVATEMGRESTFEGVDVGVYLGSPEVETDPYFKGLGPLRKGCTGCAGCMTGCRENAKNTLDKNYLFFAEKNGAMVLPETKSVKIGYADTIYSVHCNSGIFGTKRGHFQSKGLIISAGVLGTMELLLKQKFGTKSLPELSDTLGENIRTNSQSISGVVNSQLKLNHGPAITSIFSPSPDTHVELVKFNDRSGAVTHLSGFACEGSSPSHRALRQLRLTFGHPYKFLKLLLYPRWCKNSIVLLTMQSTDSAIRMVWKRNWIGGRISFGNEGPKTPAYIPEGQDVLYRLARNTGASPMNSIAESLFNMSTTAHIIGGCPMGISAREGVVDASFRVHNYPGMYIIDGSVIPSNLGVNPSLTIAALSEFACSSIPEKPGNTCKSLEYQLSELSE
jgi:cholesterol oxidase